MNNKYTNGLLKAVLVTLCLTTTAHYYADDTEIFFSDDVKGVKHNVMFIIDGSGSMDLPVGTSGDTRLDVMKNALNTVLQNAPDNLNVGLMNYGEEEWRAEGHGVKFPISDINAKANPIVKDSIPKDSWGSTKWWLSSIPEPSETITVRSYLSEITDWYWRKNWYVDKYDEDNDVVEMPHMGTTPIVDAFYEAALYFRGDKLGFGLGAAASWVRWSAHPSTYSGDLVEDDPDACYDREQKTTRPGIDFAAEEYKWLRCPLGTGASTPQLTGSVKDPNKPNKVIICHVPPGNPENAHTKSISESAIESHRAHGDYDGECKEAVATTDTPSYQNCKTTESCVTEDHWTCDDIIPGYCKEPEAGSETHDCDWVSAVCPSGNWYNAPREACTYEVCDGGYTRHPNYVSPIKQECQNNYIVLLSDGKPQGGDALEENDTYKNLKSGKMSALTDKSDPTKTFSHTSCDSNLDPSGFRQGACGPELSRFLADSDNSDLDGKQSILTYTVGFGLAGEADSEGYLKSLVTTDDSATPEIEGYFSAEDETQLSTAFSEILAQISSSTTSFAAPGYSVNAATGLSNEQVVYIPVFDKRKTPRWNGNLKKFTLGKSAAGKNIIKSKDGTAALNELGVFEDSALDIWSKSTTGDGSAVNRGGAASLIDPNNRLAVSDLNCSSSCDLFSSNNLLTNTNASDNAGVITNALLGLGADATETDRQMLVDFIRGRTLNADTGVYDLNPRMGDMLHSEPVVVTYNKTYESSASVDTKYNGQVVYAATNEGYLHAFDTTSGEELFSFMPAELLKNINTQYVNAGSSNHAYGIDGQMSIWRVDADKDGVITADSDDKVYLYFGLRRGGRSYYALDVTDPEEPKLMWKVKSTDTNFAQMGQTWSMPYLARVRTSDTKLQEVVIFTGGYDVNQDEEDAASRNAVDTMGNDIFIVDALTGDYVWSLKGGTTGSAPNGNASALTHSIPGGARLLDMNNDGAIDRLYFADTKSQVWRLELPLGPDYSLDNAKLIKFAALAGETAAEARKIYNEPDVGFLKHGSGNWLTISIGTGYRAHPANETISDNFYVLLDSAVTTPLENKAKGTGDFETLTLSDLEELTFTDGALDKGGLADSSILELESKVGWYLKLPETGEKVLANSITSNGSVMFTTLVPGSGAAAAVSDPCVAPVTQGRFYSMNIITGDAGSDLNKDQSIENDDSEDGFKKSDLFTVVGSNEIPGTPQLVFNDPTCTGETCEQIVDIRVGKKNTPVTDYDAAYMESVFWTNPGTN